MKVFETLFRGYWQFGFKTRLYDGLCPQAYHDSLKAAAARVAPANEATVLDLGCGSGLLVRHLDANLNGGLKYVGTDILPSGLQQLRQKASFLPSHPQVRTYQADMLAEWPLKAQAFDYVVAHFSVYTLASAEDRMQVYRRIAGVLKPGGRAIISNPSDTYNGHRIIKHSVRSQKESLRGFEHRVKRYLFYPLTLLLGLRHIQHQLEAGVWHAYDRDGFRREVESAGLLLEEIQPVYADSGYLLVARKP
ncbi:class I SAM-dependent methyltransferase [Nitrospina gracilis]|uniref:class I SAM-dependent methyltransferase n=1 Tax=Nitrospina gracilis TaxID=35801 RepID=UPI001F231C70|nr:class I SAM-dependent methyltransferase [Nitrospina gracilis]MCF8720781.1 SAM-dependent methyltransferase [Nitrospina gracilis Nb-211]